MQSLIYLANFKKINQNFFIVMVVITKFIEELFFTFYLYFNSIDSLKILFSNVCKLFHYKWYINLKTVILKYTKE